jgi:cell wall-associated NlpC family hydrolase
MKAIIGGAAALILFMTMLCMGVVAYFSGDDSTCTGTTTSGGAAPSIAPSLNTPTSTLRMVPATRHPTAAATAIMWALGQLGTPYSFGGDCTAAHSGDPAHQCDCSR